MTISRADIYAVSESGGEVMEELRRIMSKDVGMQDLLNSINGKRTETIEEVVARYRKETGLEDVLSGKIEVVKTAAKTGQYISKRHKIASQSLVEKYPNIEKEIQSHCIHSGGNKDMHAIISCLRETYGNEDISCLNTELVDMIKRLTEQHKVEVMNKQIDSGAIGTRPNSHHEDRAMEHVILK
jgi:hypothetical protein